MCARLAVRIGDKRAEAEPGPPDEAPPICASDAERLRTLPATYCPDRSAVQATLDGVESGQASGAAAGVAREAALLDDEDDVEVSPVRAVKQRGHQMSAPATATTEQPTATG